MEFLFADWNSLAIVLFGALVAGITLGFAGFGTALISAGFWFHALPAPMVPPLVVIATAAGQISSFFAIKKDINWSQTRPYLAGGIVGVPIGVWVLSIASPDAIRLTVGIFLVAYVISRLLGLAKRSVGVWGGRKADAAIGLSGGVLGGFAGLSGVVPMIWLRLRGGSSHSQRVTYQPFNLAISLLASVTMLISGQANRDVIVLAVVCLPFTLSGAWIGMRLYRVVNEQWFRKLILMLLLLSGVTLLNQTLPIDFHQ